MSLRDVLQLITLGALCGASFLFIRVALAASILFPLLVAPLDIHARWRGGRRHQHGALYQCAGNG
jgi:hypothetical protein